MVNIWVVIVLYLGGQKDLKLYPILSKKELVSEEKSVIHRVVPQNAKCSLKYEFHINNTFFSVSMSPAIFSAWFRVYWSALDSYDILDLYVH